MKEFAEIYSSIKSPVLQKKNQTHTIYLFTVFSFKVNKETGKNTKNIFHKTHHHHTQTSGYSL